MKKRHFYCFPQICLPDLFCPAVAVRCALPRQHKCITATSKTLTGLNIGNTVETMGFKAGLPFHGSLARIAEGVITGCSPATCFGCKYIPLGAQNTASLCFQRANNSSDLEELASSFWTKRQIPTFFNHGSGHLVVPFAADGLPKPDPLPVSAWGFEPLALEKSPPNHQVEGFKECVLTVLTSKSPNQ